MLLEKRLDFSSAMLTKVQKRTLRTYVPLKVARCHTLVERNPEQEPPAHAGVGVKG
jgi:hypothetical protein